MGVCHLQHFEPEQKVKLILLSGPLKPKEKHSSELDEILINHITQISWGLLKKLLQNWDKLHLLLPFCQWAHQSAHIFHWCLKSLVGKMTTWRSFLHAPGKNKPGLEIRESRRTKIRKRTKHSSLLYFSSQFPSGAAVYRAVLSSLLFKCKLISISFTSFIHVSKRRFSTTLLLSRRTKMQTV